MEIKEVKKMEEDDIVDFFEKVEIYNEELGKARTKIREDISLAFIAFAKDVRKVIGKRAGFPDNIIEIFFNIAEKEIKDAQKDFEFQNHSAPGGPFGGPYF